MDHHPHTFDELLADLPRHIAAIRRASESVARKVADVRATTNAAILAVRMRGDVEGARVLLSVAESLEQEAEAELADARQKCAEYVARLEVLRAAVDSSIG